MALSSFIRISIIRFASLFCTSKKSKVIFYHDIHSDKQYTAMSTPIELFKRHINIIRQRGYEIVSEITKSHGQIEICFDDGFSGLYDNLELIKKLNIPIHLFVISSFLGDIEIVIGILYSTLSSELFSTPSMILFIFSSR